MNTAFVVTTDGLISYFGPGDTDLQHSSLRLTLWPWGVCQSFFPAFMHLHDPEFRAVDTSKLGPSHGLKKIHQLFLSMFSDYREAYLLMYLPFPPTCNEPKAVSSTIVYVQICCCVPIYHVENQKKTTNDKVLDLSHTHSYTCMTWQPLEIILDTTPRYQLSSSGSIVFIRVWMVGRWKCACNSPGWGFGLSD